MMPVKIKITLFLSLKRDEKKYQEKLREIYARKPLLETDDLKTYFPVKAHRGSGKSCCKSRRWCFPGSLSG